MHKTHAQLRSKRCANGGALSHRPALVPRRSLHANVRTNNSTTPHNPRIKATVGLQEKTSPPENTSTFSKFVYRLFRQKGLSREMSELSLSRWRANSVRRYNRSVKKWIQFNLRQRTNPYLFSTEQILNLLKFRFETEKCSIQVLKLQFNVIRTLARAKGTPLSSEVVYTVKSILLSYFNKRPPPPRKPPHVWDVNVLLNYIKDMGANDKLSLMELSSKCTTLFLLSTMRRKQDLFHLHLDNLSWYLGGKTANFTIQTPLKTYSVYTTAKHRDNIQNFTVEALPDDPLLCPIITLNDYIERTEKLRSVRHLFVTTTDPFSQAALGTIHRWVRNLLVKAGIDVTKFSVHSIRSASTSAAFKAGISIDKIIKQAGWVDETCFVKYYLKDIITVHKPTVTIAPRSTSYIHNKHQKPWYRKYFKRSLPRKPLIISHPENPRRRTWRKMAGRVRAHLDRRAKQVVDSFIDSIIVPVLGNDSIPIDEELFNDHQLVSSTPLHNESIPIPGQDRTDKVNVDLQTRTHTYTGLHSLLDETLDANFPTIDLTQAQQLTKVSLSNLPSQSPNTTCSTMAHFRRTYLKHQGNSSPVLEIIPDSPKGSPPRQFTTNNNKLREDVLPVIFSCPSPTETVIDLDISRLPLPRKRKFKTLPPFIPPPPLDLTTTTKLSPYPLGNPQNLYNIQILTG